VDLPSVSWSVSAVKWYFECQVYGETSFELVDQIIRTIEFTAEDKFIDLGSGLSSSVLFTVAVTALWC